MTTLKLGPLDFAGYGFTILPSGETTVMLKGGLVTDYTDRIVRILRECSQGLTAPDVAKRLGVSSGNMSSRLSELAAYEILRKMRARVGEDGVVTGLYFARTSNPPLFSVEPTQQAQSAPIRSGRRSNSCAKGGLK